MQRTVQHDVRGRRVVVVATPETTKVITAYDRCDRCIAKAVYMVVFNNGDLYFCAHHFRENEDAFMEKALDIYDEDDEILVNPPAEE